MSLFTHVRPRKTKPLESGCRLGAGAPASHPSLASPSCRDWVWVTCSSGPTCPETNRARAEHVSYPPPTQAHAGSLVEQSRAQGCSHVATAIASPDACLPPAQVPCLSEHRFPPLQTAVVRGCRDDSVSGSRGSVRTGPTQSALNSAGAVPGPCHVPTQCARPLSHKRPARWGYSLWGKTG